MPRNRSTLVPQRGAVTAEVAIALPSLVLLLALLLGAATAGLTQLRLEEAARAGAREIVRGESVVQVHTTVRRLAGEHVNLDLRGDGGWSTVTVSSRLALPFLDLVGWELSASASARSEAQSVGAVISSTRTARRHSQHADVQIGSEAPLGGWAIVVAGSGSCGILGRISVRSRRVVGRRHVNGSAGTGAETGAKAGAKNGLETGAGTALACGFALVVLTLVTAVVLLAQVSTAAARAATAADLAALAAADASRGLTGGDPCTVAVETAALHGVSVASCARNGPGGTVVEVRTSLKVNVVIAGYPLLPDATGRARAGPPP